MRPGLVLPGVSPRVLQLFQLAKVDHLIPMAATVEEADAGQRANLSPRYD